MTRMPPLDVNIDFDRVSEFYDLYVHTTFDIPFWLEIAQDCDEPRLELMCGTGRISRRILSENLQIDGLDYSQRLLSEFSKRIEKAYPPCALHFSDARRFALNKQYGLIFVGFHSIAEVLDDADKLSVFLCAKTHLLPDGQFWLSAHNPFVRASAHDNRTVDLGHYKIPGTGEDVAIQGRYLHDPMTGIVTGQQTYRCSLDGRETRSIELPMRFHLIEPDRLDELLVSAGFTIDKRFGQYDRSEYAQESSPFYIVGCKLSKS